MKKLILSLSVLGMLSIFSACGDSSSGGPSSRLSCDINMSVTFFTTKDAHVCGEIDIDSKYSPFVNQYCGPLGQEEFDYADQLTLMTGSGCPSGAIKTCRNGEIVTYIYGGSLNPTCDDVTDFIESYIE